MPFFDAVKTIETPRLRLRPFSPSDAPAMFKNWANDSEVTRYMRWTPHKDEAESRSTIDMFLADCAAGESLLWAIEYKPLSEAIGSIGVLPANLGDRVVEVGYCIGKRWWNQGLLTEALCAVIDYTFTQTQANRLEACHSINNPASGRVMQKCGMVKEGFAKEKYRSLAEGFQDCDCYAIVKSDWILSKRAK